jgi:hypothetical protein
MSFEQGDQSSQPLPIREQLPPELLGLFQDPRIVESIATNDELGQKVVNKFAQHHGREVHGGVYDEAKADAVQLKLYKTLVLASAADEPGWGQNERDAILTIAKHEQLALSYRFGRTRGELLDYYSEVVTELPPGNDYFGAPHSAYEMGTVLAECLGMGTDQAETYRTRMQVREAWSRYFPRIEDDTTRELSRKLIEDLAGKILPIEQQQSSSFDWARKKPDMPPATEKLHNAYLAEVRSHGSFKPYLTAHSPIFSQQLADAGLKPERLWNTTDPEAISSGIDTLQTSEQLAVIRGRFDRVFSETYGLTIEQLAAEPGMARAMSDQIQACVRGIMTELELSIKLPEDTFASIQKQVFAAQEARKPQKVLGPVNKLLEALGESTTTDPEELMAFLSEAGNVQRIIGTLRGRTDLARAQIQQLRELFPSAPYESFSLGSRNEDDLYAADDTRDCTAYHLENGFNGWTVPHWLANPGFTMAYLSDERGKVAKLGLLLAQDESGARLVIDSIETSKHVTPDRKLGALAAIHQGIMELQDWADQQGLGDVFFCTYTNSTELTLELPVTKPASRPTELIPFAQGSGLQEIWSSINDGDASNIRLGYLQSESTDDMVEADQDGVQQEREMTEQEQEINEGLLRLEDLLIEYATPALNEAAGNGDWAAVTLALVAKAMPLSRRVFGDNIDLYGSFLDGSFGSFKGILRAEYSDVLRVDKLMSRVVTFDAEVDHEDKSIRKKIDNLPVHDIEPFLDKRLREELFEEAVIIDDLHEIRAILNNLGVDETTALARIYGRGGLAAAVEAGKVRESVTLRTNLRIVRRDTVPGTSA